MSHLESVCAPLPVTSIKLWNFIPFDRRRVTAVFPPNAPSDGAPAFTTRYHRFRTVPTPWSEEEGWKGRAPHKAAGDNTLDGNEHVSPGGVPFEQEKDTCPIPAELDVWVDCEGIEDFDPQCVVGMGLRARWAQIGTEDQKWWIFKLKDCEYYALRRGCGSSLRSEPVGPSLSERRGPTWAPYRPEQWPLIERDKHDTLLPTPVSALSTGRIMTPRVPHLRNPGLVASAPRYLQPHPVVHSRVPNSCACSTPCTAFTPYHSCSAHDYELTCRRAAVILALDSRGARAAGIGPAAAVRRASARAPAPEEGRGRREG